MKAILKFNLPDENYEFNQAVRASDYAQLLNRIWGEFRSHDKYSEKQETTWKEARQVVLDLFNGFNVDLDNL